jgi:hypothetical protein
LKRSRAMAATAEEVDAFVSLGGDLVLVARNRRVTRPEPLCGGADLGPEVVGPLLPGVDHHGDVGKEVVGCAHGAECRDRENNNP